MRVTRLKKCPKCKLGMPRSFVVAFEDDNGRTRVLCRPCWHKVLDGEPCDPPKARG